tara:strand:+ start:263 stop:1285 length:1023 start_codon:yes stop_codon:yes gene_type:complete
MIFGVLLIILWLPGILVSEINNKNNRLELKRLFKNLDNAVIKTGKIAANPNTINNYKTDIGIPININNTIMAQEQVQNWVQRKEEIKDKDGKVTDVKFYEEWSLPKNNVIGKMPFKINTGLEEIEIPDNKFKNIEYGSLMEPININDLEIENTKLEEINYMKSGTTLIPKDKNQINTSKKISFSSVPTNKEVTIVTDNLNNLNKLEDTKFLYPGIKNKKDIVNDKKTSNTLQRWIFRAVTFIMLALGLMLLVAPIRHVLTETPKYLNLPIISIIKPLIEAIGAIILGLWDTLSIFGSLLLTLIFTILIYLLVNYTLPIVIVLGVGTVLTIILTIIRSLRK